MKKRKRLILLIYLAVPCLAFVLLWFARHRLDTQAWVDSIEFAPDGKTLVVARFRKGMDDDYLFRLSRPGSVTLYDAKTQQLQHVLVSFSSPGTYEPGIYARYSEDGKQILVANPHPHDDAPTVYDAQSLHPLPGTHIVVRKEKMQAEHELQTYLKSLPSPSARDKVPTGNLAYQAEYRLVATGHHSGGLTIIERANKNKARHYQFPGESEAFYIMEWLPKSQILWTIDLGGRNTFWDYRQQKTVADFELKIRITCLSFNQAKDTIAYGREDGSIGVVTVDALHQALKAGTAQRLLDGGGSVERSTHS